MNKFLIFITLSFVLLKANSLDINSSLSELDTYQFEIASGDIVKIPKNTRSVIIAFDKNTADLVNEYLETKNKSFLENNSAIYIADINKIPSIICSMFVLPKLMEYKHTIYLNYDKNFKTIIPYREKKVTILTVSNSKITKISFISTKEKLEKVIQTK